jgi:CheY-like chemotaxis protein
MSSVDSKPSHSILLSEDEETEVMLFELALSRGGMSYPLIVTRDGQEAVEYLSGTGIYSDRMAHPLPSLIVLDLKMPRMTGFEVLAWLGSQAGLHQIPAVVLSSSSYPQDMRQAAQLGAREYYVKPHSLAELIEVLRAATTRWFTS